MVKRGVFAINNPNTDKQFEFFNLTLTEEEWKLFEKVKIEFDPNAEKPYREKHMFGQLERVEDEAAAFLKNLSDQNSEIAESVAKLIANLVNEVITFSICNNQILDSCCYGKRDRLGCSSWMDSN
jgi:hypothetical protein